MYCKTNTHLYSTLSTSSSGIDACSRSIRSVTFMLVGDILPITFIVFAAQSALAPAPPASSASAATISSTVPRLKHL